PRGKRPDGTVVPTYDCVVGTVAPTHVRVVGTVIPTHVCAVRTVVPAHVAVGTVMPTCVGVQNSPRYQLRSFDQTLPTRPGTCSGRRGDSSCAPHSSRPTPVAWMGLPTTS